MIGGRTERTNQDHPGSKVMLERGTRIPSSLKPHHHLEHLEMKVQTPAPNWLIVLSV